MSSNEDVIILSFSLVRKMEAEIITICVDLFRGGKDACGTVILGLCKWPLMLTNSHERKELNRDLDDRIWRKQHSHGM